ncbi:MAG: hypothetical protein AB7N76_26000 [Planctomycetota bacterium]
MSTATLSPPLPREIRGKLASTRARLRTLDFGLGLARGVLALGGALLLLFALDVGLEPPLEVIRAFALFVSMLAGLTAAYWTTRPLRRSLHDDDVALFLEHEFPELEGGLVSSVQLVRDTGQHASQALIQRTVDRTAQRVSGLDVSGAVRLAPLGPLWLLIGAFVVLSGGIARSAAVAPYADIFLQRVLRGQDVAYPKMVGFEVDLPRELRLAKGDDLDVAVKVTKGARQLERLEIVTRFADGREERRDLLRKGDLLFSKVYQNVTEPFAFRVEAPRHRVESPIYRVQVVQRPRVEQYEFRLRYPDYVGRKPEALTQPDLSVPAGTELAYVVVANKPLVRAALVLEREVSAANGSKAWQEVEGPSPRFLREVEDAAFAPGGAQEGLADTRARLAPAPEHRERTLLGRFKVTEDIRFRFQLRSEEGLETGKKPVSFTVRVVKDKAPVVTIPVPGGVRQVTPQAKVALRVDASDDYGIARVTLDTQPVRQNAEDAWAQRELPLPKELDSPRKVKLDATISLADFRLAPGDQLNYKAVAFDHNLDEARNHGTSRQYALQVVRPEDLERMLQDRLTALKERLTGAGKEQDEARKASAGFARELGPKAVLSEDDKRRVQRLEYDQRRVTTRLTEVKKALDELRAEREANRLTEQAAMSLLGELTDGVQKLAESKSPAISRQLNDALQAPRLDPKTRSSLASVPDRQQELADELRRLATRIDKYGDFTEVIQELRDLLKGEDRVIDGAKSRATEGQR